MRSLSSTKERVEIGIEDKKDSVLFSKIWEIRVIYKAGRMEERAGPCPTLTLALKSGETKPFHTYCICLLIK